MWRLNALVRVNLPVAVFLKRLAAPRGLFSFGIVVRLFSSVLCFAFVFVFVLLGLLRCHPLRRAGLGRENRVQLIAFLSRRRLDHRDVVHFVHQAIQNAASDFRMRVLAPTEEDRRFHLVALSQEALDMLLLELIVVLVHLRTKLDFLHQDDLLVFLGRARLLLLLVLELAKVHDPADRRHGRGRDLHKIQALALGECQGLRRRHDTELLAVIVDHANFADSDAFVNPRAIVSPRRAIKSDNYPLP